MENLEDGKRIEMMALAPTLRESEVRANVFHLKLRTPSSEYAYWDDGVGDFGWMSSWYSNDVELVMFRWERRDYGIYSIRGGRSLYCLHFGFSQFIRPEAYSWVFVRHQIGWLSNRSLYQTCSANPSLLYQAVWTQANTAANWVSFDFNVSYSHCWGYSLINTLKLKVNDDKSFQFDFSIWKVFWQNELNHFNVTQNITSPRKWHGW